MQHELKKNFLITIVPLTVAIGCAQDPLEEERERRSEAAEVARQAVVSDANVEDMMTQLEFIGCAPDLSVEKFAAIWKNDGSAMGEDTLIVAHTQCWEANLEVALMAKVRAGQLLFAHTQVHALLETDDPERKMADPMGFLGYLIEGGSMTTYQSYTEFRTSIDLTEAQYTTGAVARLATEEGQDSFEMRSGADTAAPLVGATDDPAGDHGPAIEAYDGDGPQFSAHELTILEEGGIGDVDRDNQSCQECIADATTAINRGAGSVCRQAAQDWLREDEQVEVLINGGAPGATTCANNFVWDGAGYTNQRPAGCNIAIAAGVQAGSPLWHATRDCLGTTGYTPQTTQNWAQQLCSVGSCPAAACDFYRRGDGDCQSAHQTLWHLVDGQTGDILFEDVGKYNEENGTNFDWDDSGWFNGRDDASDVCEYITGNQKCSFAEWQDEKIPTPYCGKLDGTNGEREDTWFCAESLVSESTRYVTPGSRLSVP